MIGNNAYCCPHEDCGMTILRPTNLGLTCPNGHVFEYLAGTKAPLFCSERSDTSPYSTVNAAELHDNSLHWLFETFGTDEDTFRKELISRIKLRPGMRILVTGVGTGNDLPHIAESMNLKGEVYAQDYSKQMLEVAVRRHERTFVNSGMSVYFSVSDAANLPFVNDYFDAAFHFGGLNLFPDIKVGISEMNRVVKPEGRVVMGDEGLAPWLDGTEYSKLLIKNNYLYQSSAPISLLPRFARNVAVSWILGNCFYVIEFTVADEPLQINLDAVHRGKRGGSIRTRYFGQLEGVDPELRDRVYAEAERRGVSRVEYIEALLRAGDKDN